jgi:hypothetical protein
MFAEVTIAGSYKNLAKSTRGATKELNIFEKNAKKISGAISAAFAGIALAGITMLTDALIDMAKAAATDRQSMALLNKTLEANWGATEQTIAGVDDYITSISYMTGIVDDDLRPAFAKIARVTKQAGSAQKAFGRVLDISAGTGKDVNLVAQAYSRYLGGNKTALDKLIPGLKDAGNRMGFLDEKYAGLAKVAGENDPFARINVVMGEFQEKIGKSFLPLVDKLAEWLTSPEATAQMDKFAQSVQEMFNYFQSPSGQAAMKQFLDDVLAIADGINEMVASLKDLKPLMDFLMLSAVNTPLAMLNRAFKGEDIIVNPLNRQNTQPSGTNVTQYVTINGVVSGNDVVKALRGQASLKGQTVLKLIGG